MEWSMLLVAAVVAAAAVATAHALRRHPHATTAGQGPDRPVAEGRAVSTEAADGEAAPDTADHLPTERRRRG